MLARTNWWMRSLKELSLLTPRSCRHTILHQPTVTSQWTHTTCTSWPSPTGWGTRQSWSWIRTQALRRPDRVWPCRHDHTRRLWTIFVGWQLRLTPWTEVGHPYWRSRKTRAPVCTYSTSQVGYLMEVGYFGEGHHFVLFSPAMLYAEAELLINLF